MSHLVVKNPGLMTTVQDLGRDSARRYGVPRSGAIDPGLLRVANALVGNHEDEAALEVRLLGPVLQVAAQSLRIACSGPVTIVLTREDGEATAQPLRSYTLRQGDTIAVKAVADSTTAYIAIAGGIDVPRVLGSRSTYVRAGLGGFQGRALQVGDKLPLVLESAPKGPELSLRAPPCEIDSPVRAVLGPQADHFGAKALADLESASFTVSKQADRMGLRLEGVRLSHAAPDKAEIISDAVVPGAIQVPGDGNPIILLADGQTVGGYPKIATVVSADLGRVGRLAPGSRIRFQVVDIEAAEALARKAAAESGALESMIRPVIDGLDLDALYTENLVGGVVDMHQPDHFYGHLE